MPHRELKMSEDYDLQYEINSRIKKILKCILIGIIFILFIQYVMNINQLYVN